jgi:antitoxin ParD1/3/4
LEEERKLSRVTSVSLDPDSTGIVERQLASGRFGDASDVVRASLRLLDAEDARLAELRAALQDGEESGPAEAFDFEAFLREKRERPRGG